jgi:Tol biopolymer transport system component
VTRTRSDWSVWTGRDADGFGSISQDGRWLTYTDWANGASLALRDVTSGATYRLTSGGSTQFSVISKDGRQVAYEWRADAPGDTCLMRIATLGPGSLSEPRCLFQSDDVFTIYPFDWSPDGSRIAATIWRKDGTKQIGLVSTRDGSLRVLTSTDWKEPTKIFFSPDGQYIAYDLMVTDNHDERHVFVMSVDPGRGVQLADVVADPSHNAVMGWSPDGRYLLFASDRSGSFGLWGVPMANGQPQGQATLLKSDIASSWSLGVTKAGTMYVWKQASPRFVQASSINLATGAISSGPPLFHRFIASRGRPAWSADGRQLAYQSCDPLGGGPCTLWIRSMDTGELRELKVPLGYFFFLRWSPNGRELLTRGRDVKGRNAGLYRIDARTGAAVRLGAGPFPGNVLPEWTADGTAVTYRRGSSVIERHLASRAEREIATLPDNAGRTTVSPDGQRIAYLVSSGPSGTGELFVVPVSGGTPRSVFRPAAPGRLSNPMRLEWTADGKALVVVVRRDESDPGAIWLVPVDGGTPRRLNIDTSRWTMQDGFHFDATGTQVVFVAASGDPGLEIRALENFLPTGER